MVLQGSAAMAGILVTGSYEGLPVTAEVGDDKTRVLVTVAGEARLVDIATGRLGMPAGPDALPRQPEPAWNPDFRVEELGGGTMIAGQFGSYHLVTEGSRICGEILVSGWMRPFMDPIARALALVARDDSRLAPRPRHGCASMPFALLAEKGWPLLASGRDAVIWQMETVRFDHQPAWQAPAKP